MSHAFVADAMRRTERCNMKWYHTNLINVLNHQKERRVRDIDTTLGIAKELIQKLDEKVAPPVVVPLREIEQSKDDSLMKPIPPEELDIFYNSTEKGGDERYLKARYKKSPEEKFYFRIQSSWDYGWQQKKSRVPARDVNHGRAAVIRHTFYRKSNAGPDPPHYGRPSGAEVSVCSEYACN